MNGTSILTGIAVLCAATALAQAPEQTVKNLQSAYQGEAEAVTFYRACAKRATQEGYPDMAKLFRAAAASEEIHRENHLRALREIGGPVPQLGSPAEQPKTTKENLAASVADEREECRVMYPDYFRQARQEDVPVAMRTFRYARVPTGARSPFDALVDLVAIRVKSFSAA